MADLKSKVSLVLRNQESKTERLSWWCMLRVRIIELTSPTRKYGKFHQCQNMEIETYEGVIESTPTLGLKDVIAKNVWICEQTWSTCPEPLEKTPTRLSSEIHLALVDLMYKSFSFHTGKLSLIGYKTSKLWLLWWATNQFCFRKRAISCRQLCIPKTFIWSNPFSPNFIFLAVLTNAIF